MGWDDTLLRISLDPVAPELLALVAFVIVAIAVTADARRRRLANPVAYGFGAFIALAAGAAVLDWIGAAVAGLLVIAFYVVARRRRQREATDR